MMIWDFYDGPRTGLAQFNGNPHYFKCLWDESKSNYSENFKLSPIDASFLNAANKNWEHYRKWELKFHNGLIAVETHPGNRGLNLEYDKYEDYLKKRVSKLKSLSDIYTADFRPRPNQEHLPVGVYRELEAYWKPS
jgi:hypothetical protein